MNHHQSSITQLMHILVPSSQSISSHNLNHLLPMSPPSKLNKLASHMLNKLFKFVLYAGLLVYILYIFLFNNSWFYTTILTTHPHPIPPSPPNATHIVFGIAASATSWNNRKHYVESWWRPNATRGYVFLERIHPDLLPWPRHSLPPYHVSQDTSMYRSYDRHKVPQAIRMTRIISETFEMEGKKKQAGVKWFVMGDDDTVFFINNLVDVLGRYDHNKYVYIGMNSECHASNVFHSFQMAFGGGGYALSYPLAEALSSNLDTCLKRYPTLYGSDHIVQSCVADLGVSITREKGFHQIDLHNDISGYLSSRTHSPLVSLHHLDQVDSIFPWLSRNESLKHLMKSAKADQSRLLQQTICYHKPNNWTFSISWGYSVHLYQSIVFPSELQKPLETFTPWSKSARPFLLFNTRFPSKDPCLQPHVFYLHSVDHNRRPNGYVVTRYTRGGAQLPPPPCLGSGNHSARSMSTIVVLSPATKYDAIGNRRECCDVLHVMRSNATEIKLRDCLEDEIIP